MGKESNKIMQSIILLTEITNSGQIFRMDEDKKCMNYEDAGSKRAAAKCKFSYHPSSPRKRRQ